MPICIECRYPVAQLYHVLHSRNHKPPRIPPPVSSQLSSAGPSIPTTGASNKGNVAGSRAGPGYGGGMRAASGADVRVMQCPRCRRFADKYVEHDFVVLFIDLVLVKPQVREETFYRFFFSSPLFFHHAVDRGPPTGRG